MSHYKLTVLLSDHDRYTVLCVFCKRLHTCTLRFFCNALRRYIIFLCQHPNHSCCSLGSDAVVDDVIACTLVSIAGYYNLCLCVLVQVVNHLTDLSILSRSNLVRIDGEEDVTANLLYLLLYRSWLRLWLRSYIFLLRSWCRSRFLYRLSLLGIDKLMGEIEARNIPMKDMNWYLDTRKYGSCPHAGFYKSL